MTLESGFSMYEKGAIRYSHHNASNTHQFPGVCVCAHVHVSSHAVAGVSMARGKGGKKRGRAGGVRCRRGKSRGGGQVGDMEMQKHEEET